MRDERNRLVRACERIVRIAAPLTPGDIRADWLREWQAEIRFTVAQHRRRQEFTAPRRTALIARCVGAFAHAAWLRWDRWRLEMLLQDLRYSLRTLLKKPGFAIVTVLTLGLGIGANTAIFSAVHAVLLRPMPFPEPDQLVHLFSSSARAPQLKSEVSPPDFVDWRREGRSFAEVAALNPGAYALTGVGAAEQVPGAQVTGGFFTVMRVPALYGRTLMPDDDAIGGAEVAVMGHRLWTRRFGADPDIVGRTVSFEGVNYQIVGVMPRGFAYPLESEVWMPLRFTERDLTTQRGAQYLQVIGRLRDGVSLEQAREEMPALALRLAEAFPNTNRDKRIAVDGLRESLVGDVRQSLILLLGAVGFVLLIVCVNVANLVLTRALGRTRETAVRTALGAGRAQLVRAVLVESCVLATAGAVTGLLIAMWATAGIADLQRGLGVPLLDQTRIDVGVMLFTLGISVAAALLFGALPAWHTASIGDLVRRIREDSGKATGDRGRVRLRGFLIVAETALAVVLLIGAGLVMRSFVRMTSVEPGFDPSQVQTFNLSLPDTRYRTPSERAEFIATVMDRIRQQPGIESAGAIFGLPLTNFRYVISMSTLDGVRLENQEQMRRSLQVRVVTSDYFRALRIPIRRGRALSPEDRLGAPLSVVVNETAAQQLWGDADPLGHRFTLGTRLGQGGANAGGTVVGVARDVRDYGPEVTPRPTVYLSHGQFPMGFLTVTVRTVDEKPERVLEPLRSVVAELDGDLPMFRVRTMEQIAADALAQPRVYLMLLALFAGTALLLAAIGIYGVLMHSVSERTREIGIRLALGAARSQVVRAVVSHAGRLAVAGLAIGLALAAVLSGLLQKLPFGVEPMDASTAAGVSAGLLAVALIAAWLPARRAARVDPVTALRYE